MDFQLISLNSQSNLGNQDLSSAYWNDETLEKNKVFKKSGFENYYHSIHKNQKYQVFILEVDNEKH